MSLRVNHTLPTEGKLHILLLLRKYSHVYGCLAIQNDKSKNYFFKRRKIEKQNLFSATNFLTYTGKGSNRAAFQHLWMIRLGPWLHVFIMPLLKEPLHSKTQDSPVSTYTLRTTSEGGTSFSCLCRHDVLDKRYLFTYLFRCISMPEEADKKSQWK